MSLNHETKKWMLFMLWGELDSDSDKWNARRPVLCHSWCTILGKHQILFFALQCYVHREKLGGKRGRKQNRKDSFRLSIPSDFLLSSHLISSHVGALKAGHFVADLFRFVRVHFPIKADGWCMLPIQFQQTRPILVPLRRFPQLDAPVLLQYCSI